MVLLVWMVLLVLLEIPEMPEIPGYLKKPKTNGAEVDIQSGAQIQGVAPVSEGGGAGASDGCLLQTFPASIRGSDCRPDEPSRPKWQAEYCGGQ